MHLVTPCRLSPKVMPSLTLPQLQIFAFGEVPDGFAVMGALLIVTTNVVVTVSKYRRAAAANEASVDVIVTSTPKQGHVQD